MFRHIKLDSIESTQTYLKNKFEDHSDSNLLVSAREQTNGHGRKQRSWLQFDKSICFSFTLPKRDNITLSTLEISCHVIKYLQREFSFRGSLKWPNDILDHDQKKCGGILVDLFKETLIVGIGLNFGKNNEFGNIESPKLIVEDYHLLPARIYTNILNAFPQSDEWVVNFWTQNCAHINQEVTIKDDELNFVGKFKGIGEYGEALVVDSQNKLHKIFNGTLRFAQST